MNARETTDRWLRELGEFIKTPLSLQDDGVCAIGYGEGRVCAIEVPDDDGPIVVHAPLLSLAGLPREALFARALALNLYGTGTAGCTIALDEASDSLVLCVSRGVSSLDSLSFSSLVGAVITTAIRLAAELAEGSDAKSGAHVPPSTGMPLFGLRI